MLCLTTMEKPIMDNKPITVTCLKCKTNPKTTCHICKGKQEVNMTFDEFFLLLIKARIVKSYYKYGTLYKNIGLDLQDVIHTIYLMLLEKKESLYNYPPKVNERILNITVTRQLNRLIGKGITASHYEVRLEDEVFEMIHCERNDDLIFFCLKDFCTEKEYTVLYQKYMIGKNFTEIGKDMGYTKVRISQLHSGAIEKIRKKMKKNFTLLEC